MADLGNNEGTKHGGSAKDLFKLIVHSPALLAAALVGIILLVYFVSKNGGGSTSGGTTPTSASNATGSPSPISLSLYTGGGYGSQRNGAPAAPTVVPQGTPATPTSTGSSTSTGTSTSTSTGTVSSPASSTVTMTSPQTEDADIRNRVGTAGSASGIPIRSTPGGAVTGYAPYGSAVPITGQTVNGPNNQPASGGPGTDVWYKTTNGGYISAYDVNQVSQTGSGGTNSASSTNTIT